LIDSFTSASISIEEPFIAIDVVASELEFVISCLQWSGE